MNQKAQTAWDYPLIIGGAVLVAIFLELLLNPIQPAERWQEEWTCTKWRDTGELTNCREIKLDCKTFDEMWDEGWNLTYKELAKRNDEYIQQKTGENRGLFCKEITPKIVCDHEQKCVQQTLQKCLITTQNGQQTRECDTP